MSIDPSSSYDELPYGDNCFPHTHPDYLATVARLFGVNSPDVAGCRVLELGCAVGGNLIPMALELPDARFVGIDLSTRQIAVANEILGKLGLRNIAMEAISITDVGDQFGEFDYIICHGVYSWVPAPVREAILATCSRLLSPTGVAYISYNTYPGWHARGMVRDMLAFHVAEPDSAVDRADRARAFLDEMVEALPDQNTSYARILRTEGKFLRGVANSYLYHEHLEETNHPLYVHQFLALAGAHGLRFLAEARTPGLASNLPIEAQEAIDRWARSEVEAEQYLDFLCNRTFRRTLLCREEAAKSRRFTPEAVAGFAVGTMLGPASVEVDVASDVTEAFRKPDGEANLTTNNPIVKAAIVALHQARPRPLPFEELLGQARAMLGREGPDEADRHGLGQSMVRCFLSDLVELHVHPPRFAVEVGDRPSASPLARIQCVESSSVTNLRRRTVDLADFDRVVLRLLDGDRDVPAVLAALEGLITSGDFTLYNGDEPIDDPAIVRHAIESELAPCLQRLAELSLLIA